MPIYCMSSFERGDNVDNAIMITGRLIDGFRCADG